MKIQILKPCRSPHGEHSPGDVVEIEQRMGDYLVAGGYARQSGIERALPVESAEQAVIAPTQKSRKLKN